MGRYYAVRVTDANGVQGPLSDWVLSTTVLDAPVVDASDGGFADRVQVSWYPVEGATDYILTRTPEGGSPQDITVMGTEYADTAAAPGQTITYVLKARHAPSGSLSPVSGVETGFRLDLSAVNVVATDGTVPNAVSIRWPKVSARDAYYRVLRTTSNLSPAQGNAYDELIGAGYATFFQRQLQLNVTSYSDETVAPGATYYYWVQVRPLLNNPNGTWTDIGSDSGFAGSPIDTTYVVSDSDDQDGPRYHWVDISNAEWIQRGARLVTPESVTLEAGSEFYSAQNLVNNSGLPGVPTLANLGQHDFAASDTAWVTDGTFGSDYYAGGGPDPKLLFELPALRGVSAEYRITELVIWGYSFSGNEGKQFQVELLGSAPPDQPGNYTLLQTLTVNSPAIQGRSGVRIPLNSTVDCRRVRVTILDNWSEDGAGGDRVGLGEVKFVATSVDEGFVPVGIASEYGYIATVGSDDFMDSSNDCPLPATPSNGGMGERIMPYHDAIDIGDGLVYYEERASAHPYAGAGETVKIWSWNDVGLAGHSGTFNFQALNFENGDWLFQYPLGHPGGASATIGWQDVDSGKAATYACNQSGAIPSDRNFAVLLRRLENSPAENPEVIHAVTTSLDEDDGALGLGTGDSLRELVKYAPFEREGVFTVIRVQISESLAGQMLELMSPISLDRSGINIIVVDGTTAPGLVLSGRDSHRIFENTERTELRLRNLTLAHGFAVGSGGAINLNNRSSLTLEGVTIRDCAATGASGGLGGAIGLPFTRRVRMFNCTLTGNRADRAGGALWIGSDSGDVEILGCTIAGNTAGPLGGGGLIVDASPQPQVIRLLAASIVADNTTAASGFRDINGAIQSGGFNLVEDPSGITGGLAPSDITGVDPRLQPLSFNGGPTQTMALLPDSPALDAASSGGGGYFLATDQRGKPRGSDGDGDPSSGPGGPDIGAYERLAGIVVNTTADTMDANDNRTSLREAVALANAQRGGEIQFDVDTMGSNLITLTGGKLKLETPRGLTVNESAHRRFALIDLGAVGGRPEPGSSGATVIGGGAHLANDVNLSSTTIISDSGSEFELRIDNVDTGGIPVGRIDWRDRGNSTSREALAILSEDILKNSAGVIRLTLEGLPAGRYEITSYHADPTYNRPAGDTLFQVLVTDASGIQVDTDIRNSVHFPPGMVPGVDGITTDQILARAATFPILADGLGEVVIYFDGRMGGFAEVPLAGLEIRQTSAPIIVSGDDRSTVFELAAGAQVRMQNMTIRDALADVSGSDGGGFFIGHNAGLVLTDCTLTENVADFGAAIRLQSGSTLLANRCTFSRNLARRTAAAISNDRGVVRLLRSTFTHNETESAGGGTIVSGSAPSRTDMVHCTFAENAVTGASDFCIVNGTGTMNIGHSLIVNNRDQDGVIKNVRGVYAETGPNLIGADDQLASPGAHGGNTETIPPMLGSPALDVVSPDTIQLPVTASSGPGTGFDHPASEVLDEDEGTVFEFYNEDLLAYWDMDTGTSALSADALGGLTGQFLSQGLSYSADGGGASGATGDRALVFGLQPGGAAPMGVSVTGDMSTLNASVADDAMTVSMSQVFNGQPATFFYNFHLTRNTTSPAIGFWGGLRADRRLFVEIKSEDNTRHTLIASDPIPVSELTAWHHLAWVKSGTLMQIWFNGRLVAATDDFGRLPTDFNGLLIGALSDTAGSLAGTTLDNIALFDQALDGGQVGVLAAGSIPTSEAAITLELDGGPHPATSLVLTSGPDQPASDPTSLRLEGSNNGTFFDEIFSGPIPAFAGRGSSHRFGLTGGIGYKYYRLVLDDVADDTLANRMRLGDVALIYEESTDQRNLALNVDADFDGTRLNDLGAVEVQTVLVNTPEDENDGVAAGGVSLRDAINSGSGQVIYFDAGVFDGEVADEIELINDTLFINSKAFSIVARPDNPHVVVRGVNTARVFRVDADSDVAMSNLIISDGFSTEDGGAIYNEGRLTLRNCILRDSEAFRDGGAIRSRTARSVLTMYDCTVVNNQVTDRAGGGISVADNGARAEIIGCTFTLNRVIGTDPLGGGGLFASVANIRIVNSTFSENSVGGNGSAIFFLANESSEIIHCTLVNNSAGGSGALGIANETVRFANSIIAGNTANSEPDLFEAFDPSGPAIFDDLGGNILSVDPGLASLGDFGGPTFTRALLDGSPALDAAVSGIEGLPLTDQRGQLRALGAAADAGAFETDALTQVVFRDRDGDKSVRRLGGVLRL